mmetsp:Transcript_48965/g.94629  ORF Transcript_48965/g.94629 Transcript_48965/m.94629 type:complete len:159 (+) Transcript_48965:55-531(+)
MQLNCVLFGAGLRRSLPHGWRDGGQGMQLYPTSAMRHVTSSGLHGCLSPSWRLSDFYLLLATARAPLAAGFPGEVAEVAGDALSSAGFPSQLTQHGIREAGVTLSGAIFLYSAAIGSIIGDVCKAFPSSARHSLRERCTKSALVQETPTSAGTAFCGR